jgi:hypothetical protein
MTIELRIHHTTGKVTRFVQNEASEVRRLLEEIRPAKVFAGSRLAFGDSGLITLCATAHITHLDIVTTQKLNWPKPPGVTAMFVLPDETALRARSVPATGAPIAGETIVTHLTYDFLGGKRLYIEVCSKAGHAFEAPARLNRLLADPPLYFALSGGGAAVLNPANIVRVLVTTPSNEPPAGVWRAELQSGS